MNNPLIEIPAPAELRDAALSLREDSEVAPLVSERPVEETTATNARVAKWLDQLADHFENSTTEKRDAPICRGCLTAEEAGTGPEAFAHIRSCSHNPITHGDTILTRSSER